MSWVLARLVVIGAACLGCSSTKSPPAESDAAPADASDDVDKAATCASTFGQGINSVGFARFDGTVVAVVPPNDQACAEPNSTHLVVQLQTGGAVYRMVIDVSDEDAPNTIRTATLSAPLVGGAWDNGWHAAPLALDYVTNLAIHGASFATVGTAAAVAWATNPLEIGAPVSIYATAQGEPDSAHLVHRNVTNQDGAIVIDPQGASPTWLLFAFSGQTF
jgi:hypothetical protein